MRPVTDEMATALRGGYARGLFVSIDHPDGTGYFFTGISSRDWNGHTWAACGKLGSVTAVKQTSELAVQDISFRLSGVDAEILAGLNSDVRNRIGRVWLACFDETDNVVPDPYALVESELDYQNFNIDDDGTATIEIIAHAGFYTLDRGVDEAWTPENQKLRFPTDTGLDMIPGLQKHDLQWKPAA